MKYLKAFILLLLVVAFGYWGVVVKGPAPKTYDCFLFFNELELLEVRLNELYEHVDHFVLVEACETFRGAPKPFIFAEHKERFKKFADKIIYIPLEEQYKTDNPWERERWQRAQIFRALKDCRDRDVICLSDLDEIIRGDRVKEITDALHSGKAEAVVCAQKMYHGFLNRYQCEWPGTVCMLFKKAKRMPTKWMRRVRTMQARTLKKVGISRALKLSNAGWHFTSVGGLARYIAKMEAYSHTEADRPELKTLEHLMQTVDTLQLEQIDETFPRFVVENRQHFEQIGFIDTRGLPQ